MPTLRVIDIIESAKAVISDKLENTWTDEELLDWFNSAQVALVTLRPDALTRKEKFLCDKSSRQELPPPAIRLIRVDRNTSGGAIRETTREMLDELIPEWHDDASPSDTVEFYVFDTKEPKAFYLYPVPVSGHAVDLVYSYAPEKVSISDFTSDSTLIAVEDTFKDVLLDYVLYRAYLKDTDTAEGVAKAQMHFQSFNFFLSGKTQSDAGLKNG